MVTIRSRPGTPHTGVVSEFDERRGLGTVIGDDGVRYPFHCTAIADGSRQIAVGTRVAFGSRAGHLGRIEARGLVCGGEHDPLTTDRAEVVEITSARGDLR